MLAAKTLRPTGCSAVPPKQSRAQNLLPAAVDVCSAGLLALVSAVMGEGHIGDPKIVGVALAAAQPFVVRYVEMLVNRSVVDTLHQQRDSEFFDELQRNLVKLTQKVDCIAQNTPTVHEAIVLIEQYRDHAARSVSEERRKLLAAAAAATFRPDVAMEMKSRAERAMATLEPSDIEALRRLSKSMCMEGWEKSEADVEASQLFQHVQTHREMDGRKLFDGLPLTNRIALEQSGCVMTWKEVEAPNWGSGRPRVIHTPVVTPLGETVLTLVETHKRDESGQAEQAGGAG